MKILGFDCSSSVIGWGFLEVTDKIKYIDSGYHKVKKDGDLIERIAHTRDFIQDLIHKHQPDQIAIEELIKFMKGASSANTIIMLTSFNRCIALVAYDYLNHSPTFHNVMSIRHGIKLDKILPKKEEIPEVIAKRLEMEFPYEKNKKGNLKVENYDRADGIAVALHHALSLNKKKK